MVLPILAAIAGFYAAHSAVINLGLIVASVAYQQNKQKRAKRAAEARLDASRGFQVTVTNEPIDIPIVYGRARLGGGVTDANVSGTYTYSAESDTSNITSVGSLSASENAGKNTYLNLQRVLAQTGDDYGIAGIADIIIDGRSYTSPDIEGYGYRATLDRVGGRAMDIATSNGFNANNRFYNAAYATETYKQNRKDSQYGGLPDAYYLIDGLVLRDIELNNNVYSVTTTRSYSNDPARVLLDYLTAPYGLNLSTDQLDLKTFYDASQICKQRRLTGVAGGGEFFPQRVESGEMFWPQEGNDSWKHSYPSSYWTGSMPTSDFSNSTTYTVIAPDSGQPATFLGSDCINVVSSGGTTTFRVNLSNVIATVPLKHGSNYKRAGWRGNTFGPIYHNSSVTNVDTFECNLALDPSQPIRENVERILETMPDADLVWSEGVYKLAFRFPENQTEQDALIDSNHNFTDDHLIGDVIISHPSDDDRLNQATVRFNNEFERFEPDTISWPPFDTDSNSVYQTYLSEDGNIPHRSTFSYEGITNPYIAEQRAETLVRKARAQIGYQIHTTPKAYTVEPGDLITLYSDSASIGTSANPEVLIVTSVQQMEDYTFRIEGVSYDYSNYGWNVDDNTAYESEPKPYGILNIQGPESVEFVQTGNDLQNTSGYVRWLPEDTENNAISYRIFISSESSPDVDTLTDWNILGESSALESGTDPDDNSVVEFGIFDAPVLKDGTYTFAVQAVSNGGPVSDLVASTTYTISNRRPTVINVERSGTRPATVPVPDSDDLDAPPVVGDIVSVTYEDGESDDSNRIIPATFRWNGTQYVSVGKIFSGDSISAGTIQGSAFTTANTENAITYNNSNQNFVFETDQDSDGVLATDTGAFLAGRLDQDNVNSAIDYNNTSYIASAPPTENLSGIVQVLGQAEFTGGTTTVGNVTNLDGVAFNQSNQTFERSGSGQIRATGFDVSYNATNATFDNNNTDAFTNNGNVHFTYDSDNFSISANGSSGGGHGNYTGGTNITVNNTSGNINQNNNVNHTGNLTVGGNVAVTGNITTATANTTGGVRVDPANTNINISANGLIDGSSQNSGNVSNIIATDGDSTVGIAGDSGTGFNLAAGSNVTVNANDTNQVVTIAANDVDTTYSAGDGITISSNNVISVNALHSHETRVFANNAEWLGADTNHGPWRQGDEALVTANTEAHVYVGTDQTGNTQGATNATNDWVDLTFTNSGNVTAVTSNSNLITVNDNNTTPAISFNGNTPGSGNLRNQNVVDLTTSLNTTNDTASILSSQGNDVDIVAAGNSLTWTRDSSNGELTLTGNVTQNNDTGNVNNIVATDGSNTVGIAGNNGTGFNIAVGSNMSVNADNTNQVVTFNANDADTTYTGTGLISISNNQVISTNATANTGNVNNATAVNFTNITGNGALDVNTNANIGANAANHTLTVTGNLDVNGTTANIGNLAINSGGTNTNLNSNAGSISLNDSVITNFGVTAEGNQAWTIPATLATGIDLTNNSNIPSGDATGWDVGDITQNSTNLDINAGSGAVSNASGQSLLIGGVDEFIRYDDANSNLEFFGHVFGPIDEANFQSSDFQAVTASSATFAPAQSGEYLFALVGAGGGGSAASGVSNNRESHAFACGGGAGGFAAFRHTINDITNQSYAVTLGSGGDLNANSNNHRNGRGAFSAPAGGSSSITFNDGTNTVNLVTVNGGGGGNAANDQTGTGGAGGTATANNANGGISDAITRTGGNGGNIGNFSGGMSGGGAPDIFGNNATESFCTPSAGASSGASCFGSQAAGDTRSGNNNGHFCTLPSTINANGGTYIMGRNGPTVSFSGDGGTTNGDYFGEYGPGSYGGITSGGAISAAASSGFVGGTAAIYSDVDGQTGPVAGNSIFGGGGAAGVTSNDGTNNGSLTGGTGGSAMFGGGGGGMAIGGAALSNSLPGSGGDAVMYYVRIGV